MCLIYRHRTNSVLVRVHCGKETYINAQGVFLLMHKYLIVGITLGFAKNLPSINHSHVIPQNQLTRWIYSFNNFKMPLKLPEFAVLHYKMSKICAFCLPACLHMYLITSEMLASTSHNMQYDGELHINFSPLHYIYS